MQIPGVLDQLKFYEGPLGAEISEDAVTLRVWAPTAQSVEVLLWEGPRGGDPQTLTMTEDRLGVWTAEVSPQLPRFMSQLPSQISVSSYGFLFSLDWLHLLLMLTFFDDLLLLSHLFAR